MADDDRYGQPVGLESILRKMALELAKEQLRLGKIDEPRFKEIEEQMFPKPKITKADGGIVNLENGGCLLYTSPSPRDGLLSRMPSSA